MDSLFLTRAFFTTIPFFMIFAALFCFFTAIDKWQQRAIKKKFIAFIGIEILCHRVNIPNLGFHNNTSNRVSNF